MPCSKKNRRSARPASLLLAWIATVGLACGGQDLPVFLSDNHAETFGWITRTFDLDAPHVLVLVDAHSDASAVERSEEVREELRRVASQKDRATRVEMWRSTGRLQAYNWIEPLMPRPAEQVVWLAAPVLDPRQRANFTREATELLDGRLEVEPRSAGSFATRWETHDLASFRVWNPDKRPIILCIDLDFFAEMTAKEREASFAAIWQRAMDWQGLAGVAFSVSRPWFGSDADADAAVLLAINAVRHTRGARLEIDASLDDRPDQSLKAAELGKNIPRWDLAAATPAVTLRLVELGNRLTLHDRHRSWTDAPDAWKTSFGTATIRPETGEIDCDGVWRFLAGDEPVLRLLAPPGASGKVRWQILDPARAAYDLLPETGLGKEFSKSPARWIYENHRSLAATEDFLLDPATWRRPAGGRIRITAEYESAHGWLPAAAIELRVRTVGGFRGALSECYGMPYVFGISGVTEGDLSGVETGWGSDCSNLLIHAWRRNGVPLAWGDPGRLRRQLATLAENASVADTVKISTAAIDRGIAIDFGKHVAALWQDREPLGVLDGNDLVLHHLGGFPEVVPLAELSATRPTFSLRVPHPPTGCRVAFAGDVVLAGEARSVAEKFGPGEAGLLVVNLEGIPSLREPETKIRFDFRFPPARLKWLTERGVTAVSLANNHALDAGKAGLIEGLAALASAGIPSFGAGPNQADACQPWRIEHRGVKLAVFGISYFSDDAAGPDTPGVAALPTHQSLLDDEFRTARAQNERILCIVHGGNEYQQPVNDDQRRWARWLTARGAVVIAGAHPHVIQRDESHAGARILHSLGNAVFPTHLKGADSGAIRIVEIP